MSFARFASFAVLLAACTGLTTPPGAEHLGTYQMHAVPMFRACALSDVAANEFSFQATFSRDPNNEQAWVTLQQYSREATFDGQQLGSVASAPRSFSGVCSGCPMALRETIRVDLLSLSQNVAAGDRCPDGPVPAVDDDAGIHAPGPDAFGYDAVRACGALLTETVVTDHLPDGGTCDATCGDCTVQYRLTGERR